MIICKYHPVLHRLLEHLGKQETAQPKNTILESPTHKTPIVYVRHGLSSEAKQMEKLVDGLRRHLPGYTIQNESYCWCCPILENGLKLADQLADTPEVKKVLVGHSMGGLVCRVAAFALAKPKEFFDVLENEEQKDRWLASFSSQEQREDFKSDIGKRRKKYSGVNAAVSAVVTIATPNSGALWGFQIANLTNLWLKPLIEAGFSGVGLAGPLAHGCSQLAKAGIDRLVAAVGTDALLPAIQDLTGTTLFHLFEECSGHKVDYSVLSISGSAVSRFGERSLSTTGKVAHKALDVFRVIRERPHDAVVEDWSVDLTQSVVPNEIISGGPVNFDRKAIDRYSHQRLYRHCVDADHFTICEKKLVHEFVTSFINSC